MLSSTRAHLCGKPVHFFEGAFSFLVVGLAYVVRCTATCMVMIYFKIFFSAAYAAAAARGITGPHADALVSVLWVSAMRARATARVLVRLNDEERADIASKIANHQFVPCKHQTF